MNNKLVEHDRRLSKMEFEMGGVRKLVRKTSEDVADIKITLTAHSDILAEHTAVLDAHTAKLHAHTKSMEALQESMVERFDKVDQKMREGFSKMAVGMAQMTAMLTIAMGQSEKPDDRGGAGDG
jgi:uncharacterized coiled-coil protein SlyX